ncbi:MAG TPA: hypothetical protein VI072_18010 [Polyangiaceae bacterium]
MRQSKHRFFATAATCVWVVAGCSFETGSSDTDENTGSQQHALCTPWPECRFDDEPDEPPPPPPPPVSKPDVALQFAPCLPDSQMDPMGGVIGDALPTAADIRRSCVNGRQHLGIWFTVPSGTRDDAAARERGLAALNLLAAGETFSGYINSRFIASTVNTAWNAAPKRLNGDGTPNPSGDIHLSSLQVLYTSPDRVASIIRGYDERPWPDVDFAVTTTDTLSTSGGRIKCDSVVSVDVNLSWLNYFTSILSVAVPPLGLFLYLDGAFPSATDAGNSEMGSVACPAVSFFPSEIVVPLGLKVAISYGRAQASTSGIVVGGSYTLVARNPSVAIVGSRSLTAQEGQTSRTASYASRATDLREPLSYQWTSSGFVSSRLASGTNVRFSLTGYGPGDVKTDSLSLRVVDADGLVATASATIRTTIAEPLEDPPICSIKPYLCD